MKKLNLSKYAHKLAAIATLGAMMGTTDALANDFSTVSTNITTSTGQIPQLVSTVAYIGGLGLGVAGVLKLKGHVDSPNNVPLKDGLVRLGAGGGLLALPLVLEAMTNTVGQGAGPTTFNLPAAP